MKKQDFIGELIEYGTGTAITVLVVLGLAAAFLLFLALVMLTAFLERLFN
jgi:hypothetical protein